MDDNDDLTVKVFKIKHTMYFNMPPEITRRFNLTAGQTMSVYVTRGIDTFDKICMIPTGKDQQESIHGIKRTLMKAGKYSISMSIPSGIVKNLNLNEGEQIPIRLGQHADGTTLIVLRPDRPTKETIIQHNDDGTANVRVTHVQSDGNPDTDKPITKETISKKDADKLKKVLKENPESIPGDVFEYTNVDMSVPENYDGEEFLTDEDVQSDEDQEKIST